MTFSGPARGQDAAYLLSLQTAQDFDRVTVEDHARPDLLRTGKYIVPAREDPALLPVLFQDVNIHPLHLEFLVATFPERFAGLTLSEYLQLVYWRETRDYFAGAVFRFRDADGLDLYGFDIYADPGEAFAQREVEDVYRQLSASLLLRPLAYAPMTALRQETARQWEHPAFPLFLPEGMILADYQAYSQGASYGRVRIFSTDALAAAAAQGRVGWQDIVVVDGVPADIETVVAGLITATPQGELSHVNVRLLRRQTPNAYLKDAIGLLRPFEGELVMLSLERDAWRIEHPVEQAAAEAWWAAHRPRLAPLPAADDGFDEIVSLAALAAAPDRDLLVRRFGGKTAGLALAYSFLDPACQVPGFAVPFHYYVEFMTTNSIPDIIEPGRERSYQEHLQELMQDARFRTDAAYRRFRLEWWQDYARRYGRVDPELVQALVERCRLELGSTTIPTRARSSSNAEDDLAFSGAGLHDSTSACAEDDRDGDRSGPSACAPEEEDEITLERALKRVWTSLWNPRAFEEREYFQMDQANVRMGVLVTPAFPDEDANGVVVTGDPVNGSRERFLVNVQQGDVSVVHPDPGVVAEKDLLRWLGNDAFEIRRVRGSSLLAPGEWVLDEAQLRSLGQVLRQIDQQFIVDDQGYGRDRVLVEAEFKFEAGQLVIKQVRPILAPAPAGPGPAGAFRAVIPAQTRACGVFQEGRDLSREHELLAMIEFLAGTHEWPVEPGAYPTDMIASFTLGPERRRLIPLDSGTLAVETRPGLDDWVFFAFSQEFLDGDRVVPLTLRDIAARIVDGNPDPAGLTFDEPFLSTRMNMFVQVREGVRIDFIQFASLGYESLPLYEVEFSLEEGGWVRLYLRSQPALAGTGPANLVLADVNIPGIRLQQSSYWHLVYGADHHNTNERYWVLFDSPVGGVRGVAAFAGESAGEAELYTLDGDLLPSEWYPIRSVRKAPIPSLPTFSGEQGSGWIVR